VIIATAVAVSACLGTTEPSRSPAVPTTAASAPTDSPVPSSPPATASASPLPPSPSDEPSLPPPSPSPDLTPLVSGPSAAADCTGNDHNRNFFSTLAAAVSWDVYCAVLPSGWFVDTGNYSIASGGRMTISYNGPSGARLELHEGAFCGDADTCALEGSEIGPTAFGDREGTLVATDGGWAVVVAPGSSASWLAVGRGMDQPAFTAIAADLAVVAAD
jgi:hypothetical protein